uniref:Uncharacterized protein n=1 Tax=Anguilla anguilla TaxID=7936 RepID=A0A0E9SJD5_ANGAN
MDLPEEALPFMPWNTDARSVRQKTFKQKNFFTLMIFSS